MFSDSSQINGKSNKNAIKYANVLKPDASSVGNHVLDSDIEVLLSFLTKITFPNLACNLNTERVRGLNAAKQFAKSTVIEVNGVKVGIIGFLTPDVNTTGDLYAIGINPEIASINAEATKMTELGINIIITLGHSRYETIKKIAENCPEVDIVIAEVQDNIKEQYFTIVKRPNGNNVPIVQSQSFGESLGHLYVEFDKEGNLVKFNDSRILLDPPVATDEPFSQSAIPKISNLIRETVVGHTKVYLEGGPTSCGGGECNLGNLITDSMIYARVLENQNITNWTDAAIAFIMASGIQSSIEKRNDGSITATDISTVLPTEDDLYVVTITGSKLRNVLEHSANLWSKNSNGGFLQVSGIRVTYNLAQIEGSRVASVEIRCSDCKVPTFEPIEDNKQYNVIVPLFLLDGGNGYDFGKESHQLEKNNHDALVQYLNVRGIVYPEIEGRLMVYGETDSVLGLTSSMAIIVAGLTILAAVF